MIGVAYRRRVIPIVWTCVPFVKGHSATDTRLALVAYVHQLIPLGIPVVLVGDSEFGIIPILKQLDAWFWTYVLRQKSNHQVRQTVRGRWQNFGDLIQRCRSGEYSFASFLASVSVDARRGPAVCLVDHGRSAYHPTRSTPLGRPSGPTRPEHLSDWLAYDRVAACQ